MAKSKKRTTWVEDPDPMIAPADRVYGEDVFYDVWPPNLPDPEGWDWKEMKRRLETKSPEERWYVIKSVDTLLAEDDSAPWVPNFIVFVVGEDAPTSAPRLSMRPAKRTEDMDPEAFVADDVVDMAGEFEWRKLSGKENVYVLSGVKEATDKKQQTGFGPNTGFAAAPAAAEGKAVEKSDAPVKRKRDEEEEAGEGKKVKSDESTSPAAAPSFSFGVSQEKKADAPAPAAAPSFSFGVSQEKKADTPAPAAAPSFSFGASQEKSDTPASTTFSFGTPSFSFGATQGTDPGANGGSFDLSAFGAAAPPPEPVFPVLWQEDTVKAIRDEIAGGMKIQYDYVGEDGTKIKVRIENDYAWKAKTAAKQKAAIMECLEKFVLKKTPAYQELLDSYQGASVEYKGEEHHAQQQKDFQKKVKELLHTPEVKEKITALAKEHYNPIAKEVRRIVRERIERRDHMRETLTAINSDIRKGLMLHKDNVKVVRIFPEKDSKGKEAAFRPSKKINKSVGAADECYPPAYVAINPLTGKPMNQYVGPSEADFE